MNFILDRKAFIYVFTRFSHLSFNGDELLWDCIVLNDFANDFDFFFEICEHIIQGHVPPSGSCFLVASRLLALEKQVENV